MTSTHVLDCIADPTKKRTIATLSDDISPVFPYVNAVMRGALYNPEAKTLTIRRSTRLLSFYERLAIFAKVDGKEDAVAQLTYSGVLCDAELYTADGKAVCYFCGQESPPSTSARTAISSARSARWPTCPRRWSGSAPRRRPGPFCSASWARGYPSPCVANSFSATRSVGKGSAGSMSKNSSLKSSKTRGRQAEDTNQKTFLMGIPPTELCAGCQLARLRAM